MGFLSQWKMYLDEIPAGPEGAKYRGRRLDATKFEKVRIYALFSRFYFLTLLQMTNEQLGQLYEFMQATKELYQPVNSKNDKS